MKEFASSSEVGDERRWCFEDVIQSNPRGLTVSEKSDLGPGSCMPEMLGA